MECIAEKHFLRFASQLARSPWLHSGYSDPQGYLPLRRAICRRLRRLQGITVRPEQVVVTSGLIQSLNLLAEVLFEPGDTVWVETPGYPAAEEIFCFRGLKTAPAAADASGLDVARAAREAPRAKGVFLASASQYPLGVPLAEDRAGALLDWAAGSEGWIIEDGTDGFLSLEGHPWQSLLQRAGNEECVIFVESFSLLISPAFKMGYIVLPEAFAEVCTAVKFLSDRSSGEGSQALLAEFLDSDAYDSFYRRISRRYRHRFGVLKNCVMERLTPYGRLMPAQFGCRAAFELTAPVRDAELSSILAGEGIPLRTISACCRGEVRKNGLILGFGTSTEKEIRDAVEHIARACEHLCG